jgi:hypothetical protein
MVRSLRALLLLLISTLAAPIVLAGTPSPHLLPLQGYATDSGGVPLVSGDLLVRIYDVAGGGTALYDSGTEFAGTIASGFLDVVLGATTSLFLDNTRLYYMEIFLDGVEMIGENSGGRWAFYPGTGSHERSDLDARLDALEALVGISKSPGFVAEVPLAPPHFSARASGAQLEYGMLGVGRVKDATGNGQVLGHLLLQPVGIFSSGDRVLKLGPLHMPPPQQVTAVEQPTLPLRTRLLGCYPNPFNPHTSIRFELREASKVSIELYDPAGRLVCTLLANERFPAGAHEVLWNGRDGKSRRVASGTYFYRFRAGETVSTRSMTLLK